ncbi:MAG: RAMP superfamily CRISPR-associated protein [Candidatus Bathyarchaeia archaeon]
MEKADVEFEKMEGFHKLKSLWRIDYEITTLEPILTQAATDETKEVVDSALGKTIPKDLPDAVPLIFEGRAIVTGNAVKGVFRHLISSQLREAGVRVCFQEVKYGSEASTEQKQCQPDKPCFACTWFGTPSRQGALYFSMLKTSEDVEKVLAGDPIPMIAIRDDYKAIDPKARAFLLLAPIKENVKFSGYITGENLSNEIIGALKEIQDISEKGFVKFGGFKTRGFGAVKINIVKIEKYGTTPFKLEKEYEKDELKKFLEECQKKYRELMSRGRSA